jgi:hypothetical protein
LSLCLSDTPRNAQIITGLRSRKCVVENRESTPVPDQDPIWKNPYQRFGFIIVNVFFHPKQGLPLTDLDLFFGPMHDNDIIIEVFETGSWSYMYAELMACNFTHVNKDAGFTLSMNMSKLLSHLGVFASTKEADRHGFHRPIPEGFTDLMKIRKKHRVTILKISHQNHVDVDIPI